MKMIHGKKQFQLIQNTLLEYFGAGNFNGSYDNSTYNFSQNTILEIEHNNAKTSFAKFLNKIEIFRQFLSLATLSPINYTEITLFDNSDFQELKDGERILHPYYIKFHRKRKYY